MASFKYVLNDSCLTDPIRSDEFKRIDVAMRALENRVLELAERYASRDTRAAHTALEQARLINKCLIDWKRNPTIKGHYYEALYYKDHKLTIRAWR